MKITPMPAFVPSVNQTGNPVPSQENIRVLKMATNATPLQYMSPQGEPAIAQAGAVDEATQPLSPQLAQLAKQRRAIQKEKEEWEKQKSQQQPARTDVIDLSRLKSEPLKVLLENGVTYDQLTQAILGNQENSEVGTLRQKIEALEKGIDQRFSDKDLQAEKQVMAEMDREAAKLISQSDEYELIRETRSRPLVMKLIERTWKEGQEVLDVPEALRLVEDELFKDQLKLQKIKKLQSQQTLPPQQMTQQRPQGMRTLTNRDTASVPMTAKARALAAFYGTLKR